MVAADVMEEWLKLRPRRAGVRILVAPRRVKRCDLGIPERLAGRQGAVHADGCLDGLDELMDLVAQLPLNIGEA